LKSKDLYSSVEVPVRLGNQKLFFFLNNRIHAVGSGCRCDPHDHSFFEIQYTNRGKGRFFINKEPHEVSTGDMLLIHPSEWHYQTPRDVSAETAQYRIRFTVKPPTDRAATQLKKNYAELNELLQSIRILKDEDLTLLKTLRSIAQELNERRDGYLSYLQPLCCILLIELIRLSGLETKDLLLSEEPKYSGYWRDRVENFLRLRYMDNIKLQDLADSIQLSTRQASRLIMREFGVNYITKLNEIRLNQAKFLLEHSDRSVHQISADCGFQNYTYFATCFKRATGMTPNEFRSTLTTSPTDE